MLELIKRPWNLCAESSAINRTRKRGGAEAEAAALQAGKEITEELSEAGVNSRKEWKGWDDQMAALGSGRFGSSNGELGEFDCCPVAP